jgi:hypothetical protein
MAIDPLANLWAENGGKLYAYEMSDPVEEDTFEVDGVPMSNFVHPSWFEPFKHPAGTKFDHLGKLKKPFSMTKGGYMIVMDKKTGKVIDPSEPFAAQADMIWLRTTRERCEAAAGKAMLAIIGLIVAGAAGAFWIGFKASLKAMLPFMLPLIVLLALAAAALAQIAEAVIFVFVGEIPRLTECSDQCAVTERDRM